MSVMNSSLISAVEVGCLPRVRELLMNGADANHRLPLDSNYRLIHLACKMGHPEILQTLIDAGCDVSAKTGLGHTPLHLLARNHLLEGLRCVLLSCGDVDPFDEMGRTPLMVGVSSSDIILLLLSSGSDPNACDSMGTSVLRAAVVSGNKESVRYLLMAGADVNYASSSGNQYTPLTMAACLGYTDIAMILLEYSADVNIASPLRMTALHEAVGKLKPCPQLIQQLIDLGADIEMCNSDGFTPLVHALHSSCHPENILTLIKNFARVNVIYEYRNLIMTPLRFCLRSIMRLLFPYPVNSSVTPGSCSYQRFSSLLHIMRILLIAGSCMSVHICAKQARLCLQRIQKEMSRVKFIPHAKEAAEGLHDLMEQKLPTLRQICILEVRRCLSHRDDSRKLELPVILRDTILMTELNDLQPE